MASSGFVTPRFRTASSQAGRNRTRRSQAKNSSTVIGGWTPGTSRHETTMPRSSETTTFDRRPRPPGPQDDERVTVERLALAEGEHGLLGRLVEEDAHDEHLVGEPLRLADDRDGLADLVGRERVERVEREGSDRGDVHRCSSVAWLGERRC